MQFSFDLPDAMLPDLEESAAQARCSPAQFAEECVLAELASRRLPNCRSPHSARITIDCNGPDYSIAERD